MNALDADLVAIVALTTGLGAMMAWMGARMNALELRRGRRRCPTCRQVHAPAGRCYRSG
jgi:hypothetical protein